LWFLSIADTASGWIRKMIHTGISLNRTELENFMVVFLSIITCSQAFGLVNRISNVVGLTPQQKVEVVNEIRKVIPSCPVTIQKDAPKQSPTGN
jgi:hypothetical protein